MLTRFSDNSFDAALLKYFSFLSTNTKPNLTCHFMTERNFHSD